MVYRTRDEIIASILRSAAKNTDGTKFTKMMYDSFLSFTQINQYLKLLIATDLLLHEADTARYRVTRKGLRFLYLFEKMDSLISR